MGVTLGVTLNCDPGWEIKVLVGCNTNVHFANYNTKSGSGWLAMCIAPKTVVCPSNSHQLMPAAIRVPKINGSYVMTTMAVKQQVLFECNLDSHSCQ